MKTILFLFLAAVFFPSCSVKTGSGSGTHYPNPYLNPSYSPYNYKIKRTGKYEVFDWGKDLNPMRNTQESPSKVLCIADDYNDEYGRCRGKAKADCLDDKTHRCTFQAAENQCVPWTYVACRQNHKATDAKTFVKTIYLTDFEKKRKAKTIGEEFANYESIEVYYHGHGPNLYDFGIIANDTLNTADKAKEVRIRTYGCSTLKDYETNKKNLETYLHYGLHNEAFEALKSQKVEITGNQFLSSAATPDNGYKPGMQSVVTLTINASPDTTPYEISLKLKDLYSCRATMPYPIVSNTRACSAQDYGVTANCYDQNRQIQKDYCKKLSLFELASKILTDTTWGYLTQSKAKDYFLYENRSGVTTYKFAEEYCIAKGGRLPTFFELQTVVEANGLFSEFYSCEPSVTRFSFEGKVFCGPFGELWSSTPDPGNAGKVYLYQVPQMFHYSAKEIPVKFFTQDKNNKHYFLCVK